MSKYLRLFQSLSPEEKEYFDANVKLNGNIAVVEKLPPEEMKTKGGLFLGGAAGTHVNTASDFYGALGVVLLTSGKEVNMNGELVDSHIKAGNIVLLPDAAVQWYSKFPLIPDYTENKIGIVMNHQLRISFKSTEEYQKLKEIFANRMEGLDGQEGGNGTREMAGNS